MPKGGFKTTACFQALRDAQTVQQIALVHAAVSPRRLRHADVTPSKYMAECKQSRVKSFTWAECAMTGPCIACAA